MREGEFMSKLIYARGIYAVTHSAPGMGRDELHGHSYEVWAYEPATGQSAEELQTKVAAACLTIDHKNLDTYWGIGMGTMENMVLYFKRCLPRLAKIVIHRPVEGLGCEATFEVDAPG